MDKSSARVQDHPLVQTHFRIGKYCIEKQNRVLGLKVREYPDSNEKN